MTRLNKRQTKKLKKKVAKMYYTISKIMFILTIICVFAALIICTADFRYSSLISWILIISTLSIVGFASFTLSLSIQKFLYRKGYIAKDKMISR